MIIFLTFVVFGVYLLVHFGIVNGYSDKVNEGFEDYFACEASGHMPGKCNRGVFERYLFPYMSAVAYILLGLLPFTVLNFVVNWDKLKKSLKRQLFKNSRSQTSNQVLTSATTQKNYFIHGHFSTKSTSHPVISTIPSNSSEVSV